MFARLHSLVVLVTIAACVAVVTGSVGSEAVEEVFSRRGLMRGVVEPSNHSCSTCTRIVNNVQHFLANNTDIEKLTEICDFVIELDPKLKPLQELCTIVPEVLGKLASYGLHAEANGPNILCADILGLCIQPCCSTSREPEQVHIQFATSATSGESASMRVGWVTLLPPSAGASSVKWRAAGSTNWTSFSDAVLREYDLGHWTGVLHFAVMTNLTVNTVYEYSVGAAADDIWSGVRHFTTLPSEIGTAARPLRFVGVTDMGFGPEAADSRALLRNLSDSGAIDLIMHPGDVGYADADQTWWDIFMREMDPIMSHVPYMTGLGNHEAIWWNATAYRHRFWTPEPGLSVPSDAGALFYSLDVGSYLRLITLNVESVINTPEVTDLEFSWLAETLREAQQAGRVPVVFQHRPMYCSGFSVQDCTKNSYFLRTKLEALFVEFGVAFVMNGHVHNYERSFPVSHNGTVIAQSYINATAPVYFVNGGAGNREGQADFYTNSNPWSAVRTIERAFMIFQAWGEGDTVTINATLLRSADAAAIDHVTITRVLNLSTIRKR